MDLSPEGIIAYLTSYIDTMPSAIMQGDVFALTITLIAFFIAVVIINQLTNLLVRFLKKTIILIIVSLAFWQFIRMFLTKYAADGMTMDTIIFGTIGFAMGLFAIATALYLAFRTFFESQKKHPSHGLKKPVAAPVTSAHSPLSNGQAFPSSPADPTISGVSPAPVIPLVHPDPVVYSDPIIHAGTFETTPVHAPFEHQEMSFSAVKDSLSFTNLKHDQNLGTVLAYLIIAQFGVYSSFSIPAPSLQVGIAFFLLFCVAGLVFVRFTYANYLTGVRHLIIAIIVGTIVAIILGYFWGNIPMSELISPAFFQSNALVALVTGLALSLFMAGRDNQTF